MDAFDNLLIPTPEEVVKQYQEGKLIGAWLDDDHLPDHIRKGARYYKDEYKREQKYPLFATAKMDSQIVGSGKGKLCTPWHFYLKQDPLKAMQGAQVTGDCVSWGTRCASDITRCWEIWGKKENEDYIVRQATALIYSGRGHTGEGASPAQLSAWHVKTGVLLEQVILDGKYDFTDYSKYVKLGMKYGRSGLPQEIIDLTSQHRMKTTSQVESPEEIQDALYNGFGCHYGFSLGVANHGDPISPLSGRTAHDTAIVGFDDTPECIEQFGETVFFIDQSWGKWNTVTNIPERWKPFGEGMYCITKRSLAKQLGNNGDAHCFSAFDGFVSRPFDNLLI